MMNQDSPSSVHNSSSPEDIFSHSSSSSLRSQNPAHSSPKNSSARRLYSRRGDLGETSLFAGPRVGKDQKRIMAIGEVDELNSFLGLARSYGLTVEIEEEILTIQKKLFDVGTEIVAYTPIRHGVTILTREDVTVLEEKIDFWTQKLPPLNHFIIPGGVPGAAALFTARAVCRRAERRIVALVRNDPTVSRLLIAWLNRLSDLLFTLARAVNRAAGIED